MIKLFRCKICGDSYIGEEVPSRCPFCGAVHGFMIEAKDYDETFDVELSSKDRANVEKSLEIELSNAAFYACAAEKANDSEARQLFKILKKVESEHASIWRKILKLSKEDLKKVEETCQVSTQDCLQESHEREDRAIKFYAECAKESDNPRLRQIFGALVQIETDHLQLSEQRLD
ncbi:ferritin [Candidatus Woesearchaeota archaeon]|jgi:rubrerythrin|nr:ferritin [Candidatus Woesearchaeota archaeon]